jgi:hypothetical protein
MLRQFPALQTLAGAGSLLLNGTLSTPTNPAVILHGVSRRISITSTGNLAAKNFTITGTYLGAAQTATIAGPNNNTVETTVLFETVTSVTVDAAVATNVSVGTGSRGHTAIYKVNEQSQIQAMSAQVIVTGGTLTYSFLSSLQLIDANFAVANGQPTIYTMNAVTASAIGAHGLVPIVGTGAGAPTYNWPVYCHLPVKHAWFSVTETLGQTGSLVAYLLQQGA